MGRYDDITPERLRADLSGFAELILRLEREDSLLESVADLQKIIGELRQKLFAYEIRSSHLKLDVRSEGPPQPAAMEPSADPVLRNSLKVVREALRRTEEMLQEWQGTAPDDGDEDD